MLSPVDKIKERLSITEVIGSYIKLEKSGVNFKARCPFHNERTPSFFVSPARGTYHCFGCNRGGDIFSFVEEIEGLQFRDVLKMLADKAGVELPKSDRAKESDLSRLEEILLAAARIYEENLQKAPVVVNYLKERGLTDETIKKWRLGYSTRGWDDLILKLRKIGFTDTDVETVGLSVKGERGYFDRFRSRIMFPLFNSSGRIVGFSGRIFLPEDKVKEAKLAKYVNTPETPLYHKSEILYGFDKAKSEILRSDCAVLVEGQMDLIVSHQAGISNAVALSGTALTENHIRLIKRLTDKLILALDSDNAGINASERSWQLAVSLGMDVKVAVLPSGFDPGEYGIKDPAGFKDAILKSKHIVEFLLENLRKNSLDERAFRLEVSRRVLPYIANISNKIDQAYFVSKVARELSTEENHVWDEVEKVARAIFKPAEKINELTESKPVFSRKDFIRRRLKGLLFWQEEVSSPTVDLDFLKMEIKRLWDTYSFSFTEETDDKNRKEMIFEAEMQYLSHENLNKEMKDLVKNLERELIEEKLFNKIRLLKESEGKGESEQIENLLKECQSLSLELQKIKNN